MTEATQHTRTPWEVNERAANVGSRKRPPIELRPKGVRHQVIADDIRRIEDAQHIVRCVNAHDELVAVLQAAVDATKPRKKGLPFLRKGEGCTELCQEWEEPDWVAVARAALATVAP